MQLYYGLQNGHGRRCTLGQFASVEIQASVRSRPDRRAGHPSGAHRRHLSRPVRTLGDGVRSHLGDRIVAVDIAGAAGPTAAAVENLGKATHYLSSNELDMSLLAGGAIGLGRERYPQGLFGRGCASSRNRRRHKRNLLLRRTSRRPECRRRCAYSACLLPGTDVRKCRISRLRTFYRRAISARRRSDGLGSRRPGARAWRRGGRRHSGPNVG